MDKKNSTITLPLEILSISNIEIESTTITVAENEIVFRVNSTEKEIPCRLCKRPTESYGRGRELKLRHLPVFGMRTYILITPRRGICRYCDENPTTTQRHDWYDIKSKYTKPYEQHVLFELINSTVADVGSLQILFCMMKIGFLFPKQQLQINFRQTSSVKLDHFF